MRFEASTESGSVGFAEVDTSVALGRGGVAVIHPAMLAGNSCAAKIFNSNRVVNADKIMAMIANPPDSLSITIGTRTYPKYAWPTSLLRSPQGVPVGFLMPVVDQTESFTLDHYYDNTLIEKLESPEEVALSFKLEIASNLSRSVSELHKHGHYFIDLKPQNIRVFRRTHIVTLIDCDGFSIQGRDKRFPAEMLSADYIAPEAYRGNIYPQNLSEPQDRYALAVILFQLLNGGTHPFQGIVTDASVSANTNDEKAAAGLYPHGLTPNPRILPRPQSIYSCFDDETRSLFDLSFTGTQSERPSAEKWAHHFKKLLDDKALVGCNSHPFDIRHMRFQGRTCPTCYLEIISSQRTRVLPGRVTIKPTPTTKVPKAQSTSKYDWHIAILAWIFIIGFAAFIWPGFYGYNQVNNSSPMAEEQKSHETTGTPSVTMNPLDAQSQKAMMDAIKAKYSDPGAAPATSPQPDSTPALPVAVSKTRPVVVAQTNLNWGNVIDNTEMVGVKPYLEESLPPGTFSDPSSVIKRVVIYPIEKGEPILESSLAPKDLPGGVAAIIAPGKRAVAIKVDKTVGGSGFIHPNNRVDVLVTITKQVGGGTKAITKTVLENMLVLATGPVDVITLEMTPQEAEKLALASTKGKLVLILRPYPN